MNRPRFSVIIPAYNSEQTILNAVGSVLCQDEPDLEVLVIDDGSTDATFRVIESVADPRLRCFRTDNRGVSAARNFGIAQSGGEIITFLDSDDTACPNWLSVLGRLLESESVGIAFCGMHRIAPNGRLSPCLPAASGIFGSVTCLFLAGTYAVRRALMEQVGGFDPKLRYSENTELGIRLLAACAAMGLGTAATSAPLVRYSVPCGELEARRLEDGLAAGRLILDKHNEAFRRDSSTWAHWLAGAGVTAARLGRFSDSRRFFLRAILHRPWRVRNYGRLVIALSPRTADRVWGTARRATADESSVLFVSFWPYLGGAQTSLLTVLAELPAHFHAILACPDGGPLPLQAARARPELELVKLSIMPPGWKGLQPRVRSMCSIALCVANNRRRLFAVHANGDAELKLVLPVLPLLKRPVVVWFHSKLMSPTTVRMAFLWRLLRRRVLWAPVSQWLLKEGIKHQLFSHENALVVPNPINPADVVAERARAVREMLTVGYLGGEFEDKGIITVASVAQQMVNDPVRFIVVTKQWGPERNSARVNEALDRLRALPGSVDMRPPGDIRVLFGDMDVLLVPSQAESFCRIAAEAMMNGIPVAGSRLPALEEVVGDDEAGILFPVDDADAAVDALRCLCSDDALRHRLGSQGKIRARRYEPAQVLSLLMAAYRATLPLPVEKGRSSSSKL